jgi:hypothetical protein
MACLLDLPAEIRNRIWKLCLVSPTGIVQPVNRRDAYYLGYPGSFSLSGPFFYLVVDEHNFYPKLPGADTNDENPRTISLSLPRVCRQVYIETNDIFWTNNAFLFWSPHSLLRTFKGMSEYPFRHITSIRLHLQAEVGNELEIFDQTLELLIKQARTSSLRNLELRLKADSIKDMVDMKRGPVLHFGTHFGDSNFLYERFLPSLKKAQQLHNVEKVLVITDLLGQARIGSLHELFFNAKFSGAFRDIHEAWGGNLQWGSTLVRGATEVDPDPPSIQSLFRCDASRDIEVTTREELEQGR